MRKDNDANLFWLLLHIVPRNKGPAKGELLCGGG